MYQRPYHSICQGSTCAFCHLQLPLHHQAEHERSCPVLSALVSNTEMCCPSCHSQIPPADSTDHMYGHSLEPPIQQLSQLLQLLRSSTEECSILFQGPSGSRTIRRPNAHFTSPQPRTLRLAHTDYQGVAQNCAICLESIQKGQNVGILVCAHCFHAACLSAWTECHRHCPICRVSI